MNKPKFLKIPLNIKQNSPKTVGGFFSADWFPLNVIILGAAGGIIFLIYWLLVKLLKKKPGPQKCTKDQTQCGMICCDKLGPQCCNGQCIVTDEFCCVDGELCPSDQCGYADHDLQVCCKPPDVVPDPYAVSGCTSCHGDAWCRAGPGPDSAKIPPGPAAPGPATGYCTTKGPAKSSGPGPTTAPFPWQPPYTLPPRCKSDKDCNYTLCPTKGQVAKSCCIESQCIPKIAGQSEGGCCHENTLCKNAQGQNIACCQTISKDESASGLSSGGCCTWAVPGADTDVTECCPPDSCCSSRPSGDTACNSQVCVNPKSLEPKNGKVPSCKGMTICKSNEICNYATGTPGGKPKCDTLPLCGEQAVPQIDPYPLPGAVEQGEFISATPGKAGFLPLYNCGRGQELGTPPQLYTKDPASSPLGCISTVGTESITPHHVPSQVKAGLPLYMAGLNVGQNADGEDADWASELNVTAPSMWSWSSMGTTSVNNQNVKSCSFIKEHGTTVPSCICGKSACEDSAAVGFGQHGSATGNTYWNQPVNEYAAWPACFANTAPDAPKNVGSQFQCYAKDAPGPGSTKADMDQCVTSNINFAKANPKSEAPCIINSECSFYLEPATILPVKESFTLDESTPKPQSSALDFKGGMSVPPSVFGEFTKTGPDLKGAQLWQYQACSDDNVFATAIPGTSNTVLPGWKQLGKPGGFTRDGSSDKWNGLVCVGGRHLGGLDQPLHGYAQLGKNDPFCSKANNVGIPGCYTGFSCGAAPPDIYPSNAGDAPQCGEISSFSSGAPGDPVQQAWDNCLTSCWQCTAKEGKKITCADCSGKHACDQSSQQPPCVWGDLPGTTNQQCYPEGIIQWDDFINTYMLASSKWNAEKFPAGILKQQSMLMCFGPDGNGDGYWASSYTDCAINAASAKTKKAMGLSEVNADFPHADPTSPFHFGLWQEDPLRVPVLGPTGEQMEVDAIRSGVATYFTLDAGRPVVVNEM